MELGYPGPRSPLASAVRSNRGSGLTEQVEQDAPEDCRRFAALIIISYMSASEDATDTAVCTLVPRWSRWRWPLVIPVFLAGWVIANWAPLIGTRTEYQEEGLIWIGYTLAGFIPVYLAGKVAPSRQLPLAIECALLVGAFTISVAVLVVLNWLGGSEPVVVLAVALGYSFATLAAAAWAVWLVRRKRAADPERGSTWAQATGVMLPVALFFYIYAEGSVT